MPSYFYQRIRELNPQLNAFITVIADARGEGAGRLAGVSVAIKDMIDTAGVLTTAGSAIYKDRIPEADAECVRRLKAAGAVIVGKTNTHEFAFGPTGAVSFYGPTRNPHNPEMITGGSSGGSAAAVATGMCDVALGTDTGGSVRIPAALCGVVGFKPGFGKVSTEGVIPLSTTFDHVGPLAKNVADAAKIYEVISGEQVQPRAPDKVRVGVVRDYFFSECNAEIAASVEASITLCSKMGWDVRDVTLPCQPDFDLYSTVGGYEIAKFHRQWMETCPELYQPATRKRLELVAKITREQYEVGLAEVMRQREAIAAAFADCDVVLTPTVRIATPTIQSALKDGVRALLYNTAPFNVWGLPAISLPCGKTKAGMPIGLQLASAKDQESLLLSAAAELEARLSYSNDLL